MYFVRMTWYYLSLSNYYLNYTYNHIQIYTCTYIYTCRDNSNTQLNIHLWLMSAKSKNHVMSKKNYKPCLVQLMNYLDSPNPPYSIEKEFNEGRLLQITDKEVYSWLCTKAYGKSNATSDDNLIGARSNSIYFLKKVISFFM